MMQTIGNPALAIAVLASVEAYSQTVPPQPFVDRALVLPAQCAYRPLAKLPLATYKLQLKVRIKSSKLLEEAESTKSFDGPVETYYKTRYGPTDAVCLLDAKATLANLDRAGMLNLGGGTLFVLTATPNLTAGVVTHLYRDRQGDVVAKLVDGITRHYLDQINRCLAKTENCNSLMEQVDKRLDEVHRSANAAPAPPRVSEFRQFVYKASPLDKAARTHNSAQFAALLNQLAMQEAVFGAFYGSVSFDEIAFPVFNPVLGRPHHVATMVEWIGSVAAAHAETTVYDSYLSILANFERGAPIPLKEVKTNTILPVAFDGFAGQDAMAEIFRAYFCADGAGAALGPRSMTAKQRLITSSYEAFACPKGSLGGKPVVAFVDVLDRDADLEKNLQLIQVANIGADIAFRLADLKKATLKNGLQLQEIHRYVALGFFNGEIKMLTAQLNELQAAANKDNLIDKIKGGAQALQLIVGGVTAIASGGANLVGLFEGLGSFVNQGAFDDAVKFVWDHRSSFEQGAKDVAEGTTKTGDGLTSLQKILASGSTLEAITALRAQIEALGKRREKVMAGIDSASKASTAEIAATLRELYELNLRRRSLSRDVAIALYTAVAHHFTHSTASGQFFERLTQCHDSVDDYATQTDNLVAATINVGCGGVSTVFDQIRACVKKVANPTATVAVQGKKAVFTIGRGRSLGCFAR